MWEQKHQFIHPRKLTGNMDKIEIAIAHALGIRMLFQIYTAICNYLHIFAANYRYVVILSHCHLATTRLCDLQEITLLTNWMSLIGIIIRTH